MLFTSYVSKIKVNAVKFIKSYLYVATGGNLIVYDVENYNCNGKYIELINENIFQFVNIYGINPDENKDNICLFGGKYVKVISSFPGKWPNEPPWRADDWIWNVRWLNKSDLALITGHNTLFILQWPQRNVVKVITCEEKCILYSALIVGDNINNNLVLISGTVYTEVLIWAPHIKDNSSQLDGMVIHRLKGHNGVIFSVNYDKVSQTICSTSDDRTVRVWRITLDLESSKKPASRTSRYLTVSEWKSAAIQPLYCVFGHSARVFNSCMLSNNRIISISEDSYMCIWNKNGNKILRQETHQGGKVCCVDFSECLKLAATGGADGGISLWPIPKTETDSDENISTNVYSAAPIIPSHFKLDRHSNLIVAGRNCNRLYVFHSIRNEWCIVLEDDRISNYCLLESSPSHSFVAVATASGHVIVLKTTDQTRDITSEETNQILLEKEMFAGRILSLIWLSDNLLLCCGRQGTIFVCKLSLKQEGSSYVEYDGMQRFAAELNILSQFVLPPSKERWVTSAVLFDGNLVCGDRGGSIHVFRLTVDSGMMAHKDPVLTFNKIHDRLGVNCLTVVRNKVWSCGRDGNIRQFSLSNDDNLTDPILKQVSVDKIVLPWAAKIIHTDRLGTLILGFHQVNFVIWSMDSRTILWKCECGGGHREWDCVVDDDGLSFYFLKDKIIKCVSMKFYDIARPPVMDGFHTRQINTLTLLTQSRFASESCSLAKDVGVMVISGSEDNLLKISLVSSAGWRTLHTLAGHLSSIRTVAALSLRQKSSAEEFLIFSAGGRAQLKIWQLEVTTIDGEFSFTSSQLCSHMLRRKGERVKRPWKDALPVIDPETRYMDLAVQPVEGCTCVLGAACSDGYLRLFSYNIVINELEQLYRFEYQKCLLKSSMIHLSHFEDCPHPSVCNSKIVPCRTRKNVISLVLTAATDGVVTFWNLTNENSIFSLKAHQSGINACDILIVKKNSHELCNDDDGEQILLVTGGDDCSVVINILSVDSNMNQNKFETVYCSTNNSLHVSQVTGVKIIDNYIFTAGIDQRINLLEWKFTPDGFKVNLIACRLSVVADIHGIETWKHSEDTVAVCAFGIGTEVFHFKK